MEIVRDVESDDETSMTKLTNIDSQGNDQFVMELANADFQFHVPLMKKINLNT